LDNWQSNHNRSECGGDENRTTDSMIRLLNGSLSMASIGVTVWKKYDGDSRHIGCDFKWNVTWEVYIVLPKFYFLNLFNTVLKTDVNLKYAGLPWSPRAAHDSFTIFFLIFERKSCSRKSEESLPLLFWFVVLL